MPPKYIDERMYLSIRQSKERYVTGTIIDNQWFVEKI